MFASQRLSGASLLRRAFSSRRVFVAGAAMGLPSAFVHSSKPAFHHGPSTKPIDHDDSPFRSTGFVELLQGQQMFSPISREQRAQLFHANVPVTVTDSVTHKKVKHHPSKLETVKIVARACTESIDVASHGIPPAVYAAMDTTSKLAVIAGLEALKTAGITVVKNGKIIPLPANMQNDTGVIFASVFPSIETSTLCANQLVLSDIEHRMFGTGYNVQAFDVDAAFSYNLEQGSEAAHPMMHEFDKKMMMKAAVFANQQLAELIKARGPNLHVNAACGSMAAATTIAEDWIRSGRCNRVIVLSGEDCTNDHVLPLMVPAFVALGTCTVAATPEMAGMAFDKRRSGMVLSAGSSAILFEESAAATERSLAAGIKDGAPAFVGALTDPKRYQWKAPRVELIASQLANSAYHGTKVYGGHIGTVLEDMVAKFEKSSGITRAELAKNMLYFSHDAGSAGCITAEVEALKAVFKTSWNDIVMCNTKWMTGHALGCAFEDVTMMNSLAFGVMPALQHDIVANVDPVLDMKASQIEKQAMASSTSMPATHTRQYGIRFAAGLGSHCIYVMYKKL